MAEGELPAAAMWLSPSGTLRLLTHVVASTLPDAYFEPFLDTLTTRSS